MRRVPAPLAALLALALVHAVAWAVVLPAFQGPDDIRHFTYVQRMVDERTLPWTAVSGVEDDPVNRWSTETLAADRYSGAAPLRRNAAMRPYSERVDEERWAARRDRLTDADREDAGYTPAMRNPPLYYAYAAIPYAVLSGADVLTREMALGLASAPFLLVAVLGAWLLAGEVFGRRRLLQAITAGTVALQPMLGQVSGIASPDALIAAEWAIALWLCAVVLRRGPARRPVLALAAVAVAGALTHGRVLPLAAVAVAAVLLAAWRSRGAPRPRAVAGGVAAVAIAGAAVLVRYALNGEVSGGRVRELASYVWQFYLPKPGFLADVPQGDYGVREVAVDRLWSSFAHYEIALAPGLLDAVWVGELGLLAAVLATLVVRRDAVRARWPLAAILTLAVVLLLASLHAEAWRSLLVSDDPVITGRYLTPLLPLAGLGLAAVVAALPRRAGPALGAAVLSASALLTLSALAATVVRFHA